MIWTMNKSEISIPLAYSPISSHPNSWKKVANVPMIPLIFSIVKLLAETESSLVEDYHVEIAIKQVVQLYVVEETLISEH